jgi:hypothetical protein
VRNDRSVYVLRTLQDQGVGWLPARTAELLKAYGSAAERARQPRRAVTHCDRRSSRYGAARGPGETSSIVVVTSYRTVRLAVTAPSDSSGGVCGLGSRLTV